MQIGALSKGNTDGQTIKLPFFYSSTLCYIKAAAMKYYIGFKIGTPPTFDLIFSYYDNLLLFSFMQNLAH